MLRSECTRTWNIGPLSWSVELVSTDQGQDIGEGRATGLKLAPHPGSQTAGERKGQ